MVGDGYIEHDDKALVLIFQTLKKKGKDFLINVIWELTEVENDTKTGKEGDSSDFEPMINAVLAVK